jgi:hypothetical protein
MYLLKLSLFRGMRRKGLKIKKEYLEYIRIERKK